MGSVSTNKLTSVLVLLDVVVIFFSSFAVITPNGNFWDVPLLHSVSCVILTQSMSELSHFTLKITEVLFLVCQEGT